MKFLSMLLVTAAIVVAKPTSIKASVSAPHDRFQAGLGRAYEGYLNIQLALSNDDLEKAGKGSGSMIDSLKKIGARELDGTSKTSWDSISVHMTTILHSMASSKDLDAMRLHFKELTPLMADAIEKFGMKSASPAFLFHCPMANANWIQKDRNKANPYYGKSMPECGSLIREEKVL